MGRKPFLLLTEGEVDGESERAFNSVGPTVLVETMMFPSGPVRQKLRVMFIYFCVQFVTFSTKYVLLLPDTKFVPKI